MSSYLKARSTPRRFRPMLASFLQHPGLPFADALPEEAVQKAFDREHVRFGEDEDAVYTPAMTLWAFLSQVLFKHEQRSCIAAVMRVAVLLVTLQRKACSCNTGAYCRARAKLPQKVMRQLTIDLADGCENQLDEQCLWRGRHVYLIDGTTLSMADTPQNQTAYPQQPQQQAGLGFPIVRAVVSLSLASVVSHNCNIFPSRDRKGVVASGTVRQRRQPLPDGRGSVHIICKQHEKLH